MSRHRRVLDELRPPGGWWQQPPAPITAAPDADDTGLAETGPAAPVEPGPPAADPGAEPARNEQPQDHPQARPDPSPGLDPTRWPPKAPPSRPRRRPPTKAAAEAEAQHRREGETREWMRLAACRGVDTDLFFPERGESTREAKQVCRGCPVREPCLEYALANGEKHGIWGGLSERERRPVRRARAAAKRNEGAAA